MPVIQMQFTDMHIEKELQTYGRGGKRWEKYIGMSGKFIGMCGYGTSAPLEVVLKHFGMTVEAIVAAAKELDIRKNN